METKTYYIAGDESDLDTFDQHTLHPNPEDALEEWVDGYETPPKYIFKVEVTQRARVVKSGVTIQWEIGGPTL